MTDHHEHERLVVAYTADSTAEALVIRRLLESNGIVSPDSTTTDPFPLNEPPEGTHGTGNLRAGIASRRGPSHHR